MTTDVRFFGCNLCEAMCGLKVTLEGDRVHDVRGDADDVFSHGHICPKGVAMRDLHEDPDRLRTPMRRTATGFEPVGWDEALFEAAARLREVQARHGRDAVAFYIGNPTVHSHRASLGVQTLALALRTHNLFNPNSQDSNPRLFACLQVYGNALSVPVPDIDRTDLLIMLGANPIASMGSMWALGDARARLQSVKKRGGRLVLFDPRRTETATICDEHHFIRPASDAAFLLALIHVLFDESLVDNAAVDRIAEGRRTLERATRGFSPERVATATGIPADVTRRLARELAHTPRAAVYGRLGTCQTEFGPLASWLIEALNAVSGHFDREGGMMFPLPAADVSALTRHLLPRRHGRWRSRVRGLPEFLDALPSAAMAEEMETPGEGQVRALVCFAGDPVLSTPNGPRLAKAIEQLGFVLAIDFYLNETSRRAHIVLPPVHVFESGNYELVLGSFAVRPFARYSPPILPKPAGMRDDWEILSELAGRVVGLNGSKFGAWVRRAGAKAPEAVLDLLLKTGRHRLSLAKLADHPHGKDLGPLTPARHERVQTDDRRVHLAPDVFVRDLPRLERWLDAPAPPIVLIGRRHMRSNNSWMHNLKPLVKGPSRAQLMMHPLDARARGIASRSRVRVRSRAGEIEVDVEVTDDVRPGVVSMPHGFGHDEGGLRLAGGLGPNVNAITDEQSVEPVLGNSILSGIPVDVDPIVPGAS